MVSLRIAIIGPGRAGGSIGIAARAAGHDLVGCQPGPSGRVPLAFGDVSRLDPESPIRDVDLVVVGVRDDLIVETSRRLAERITLPVVVAHLSGFTSIHALDTVGAAGARIGGLHPLQTLPDPEAGAAALAGATGAVTADDPVAFDLLWGFAQSIGLRPIALADESKPVYHAAAAASSNFVVTALGLASDLFEAAGLDPMVAEPLVDTIIANVRRMGPDHALTGPVARGDVGTVVGQIAAVRAVSPALAAEFEAMIRATAIRAGTERLFEGDR